MAGDSRWDGWLGPKQWMPIVGILSLAVIALAVMLVLNLGGDDAGAEGGGSTTTTGVRPPVHLHADFALVIRGQKFDFNQEQFLSEAEGRELSANVHIHAPRTDVVHVHTAFVTWDEFLRSVGFKLDDPSFPGITAERTCMTLPSGEKLCNSATETWKFIANGIQVDGLSNVQVGDLNRVLFSYGPESFDQVMKEQWTRVTDQACIPSELCASRIPADEPPEQCSGKGLCGK